MSRIYPPTGAHDDARYQSVNREEREYLWFCIEFCSKILETRPVHVEALEMAANHFTEMGYFADGLRLDERLAALKPDDPGVLYNLTCSLALTGETDAAFRTLERAVECGYDDTRHMTVDRDLAPLRDDPRFGEILARAGACARGKT